MADGPIEGLWELPEGWRWERLGDVLPLAYGKALPAASRNHQGSISVYSSSGITGQHDVATCYEPALIVGRKGAAGAIHHATGPSFVIDTAYYCSRSSAEIDLRLGYHLLTFMRLRNLDQSTAVPSLSRDRYDGVLVPVPRRDIQARLAGVIDDIFTDLDDGEALLARARDDLGTWRKALLKAAVTGELTADWRAANPATETGADLLAKLAADHGVISEILRGEGQRYKLPGKLSSKHLSLMWKAPTGWGWAQLGYFAFVTKLAGFEYTKYVRYDEKGDLRVIKAENASRHGFKSTNFSRIFSSSVSELTRSRLSGGELLMVFVGAGTGNVGIVPSETDFFLGPNIAMMRIETALVLPRFVELFLRSTGGNALATAQIKAVAQPSLSMGTIRQIPILLPPLEEQIEILSRLERGLSEVAACENVLIESETAATTLRQSILSAAFCGDLVA